jgi:aminoglycoside/choline kinase family phosphotransferase
MIGYHNEIIDLFERHFGQKPELIMPLPVSGSNRQYYRVTGKETTAIATYNTDRTENEAFLYITRKLKDAGINVPTIYASNLDRNVYLQEDLGDIDLFRLVSDETNRDGGKIIELYKRVIDEMPRIQYKSAKDFDFSICYPRHAFDRQSMHWDLSYFKYHFLKLAYTPFHEQKLEDDFNHLIDFLQEAPSEFFLYRDFQSRNIMIHNEKVFFIDYQGGRKGALQYDLASLLFEAKTNLNANVRKELLDYYIQVYKDYSFFDREVFLRYFPGYALIRLLQAFGAYGYRGYFERKPYFLQSIPPAIASLKWLLSNYDLGISLPHLTETLFRMVEQPAYQQPELLSGKLTVTINSFSYRKGIPEDFTGNGGGFVFDCRAIPNPGRLEEFKTKTGRDQEVINFLTGKQEVEQFIEQIGKLVSGSITEYQKRQFGHIMISFGCTGGQHRSVYFAERLSKEIQKKFECHVQLRHQELDRLFKN